MMYCSRRLLANAFGVGRCFISTSSAAQDSYKFVVAGGGAGGIGTAACLSRIYGKDAKIAVIEPSQVRSHQYAIVVSVYT